jgi:phosphatidylglycerophosphatase A
LSIFLKDHYGNSQLSARQILRDPVLLLAFGFGSGLARKMPGTVGTLAAIPIYWLFYQTGFVFYSVLTVLTIVGGIWICDYAAEKLQCHDFGGIVWDEVAGLLITLWWVPFSGQNLVLGFLLFRLFDILKPWPIKWADRKVTGGFGIMLDDVLAGLLAALSLFLLTNNL